MFINKIVNHHSAWEYLSINKPDQVQEIINSLQVITPKIIESSIDKKIRREIKKEIAKEIQHEKIFALIQNTSENRETSPFTVGDIIEKKVNKGITNWKLTDKEEEMAEDKAKITIRESYLKKNIDINEPGYIDKLKSHNSQSNKSRIFIGQVWNKYMSFNGWPSFKLTDGLKQNLYLKHFQKGTSIKLFIANNGVFANWVYIETQKAYETGKCEVSVLLVPMNSYKDSHLGSVNSAVSFEELKSQLDDLSPIRTSAPFIIIGFSDIKSEIEILDSTITETNNEFNSIEKCIEFSPEHYQAGMGILSYFGEIIKTKHPDIQAKVKIEQDGNFVRLHIETEDGTKEIIEKTLESYSLVISNQAPVETLFDNKLDVIKLEHKLERAYTEVRQTRDLIALSREFSDARILSLEDEVQHLRSHIGSQMGLANKNNDIIKIQAKTSNKIANGLIDSSRTLLSNLITDNSMNSEVLKALNLINNKLESKITDLDETEIKAAIETINENSPSILGDLETALKSTAYGVSGNIVYKWLISISNTIC